MQNPAFRRTLVIGLGGAGRQAATAVKARFFDTFGVVPPCVKVFCLDTDGAASPVRSAGAAGSASSTPGVQPHPRAAASASGRAEPFDLVHRQVHRRLDRPAPARCDRTADWRSSTTSATSGNASTPSSPR